jgi:hypothetical protein
MTGIEERREMLRQDKQHCEVEIRMVSERIRRAEAAGIKERNPDGWLGLHRERDALRMKLYRTKVQIAATYPTFNKPMPVLPNYYP